MHNVIEVTNN